MEAASDLVGMPLIMRPDVPAPLASTFVPSASLRSPQAPGPVLPADLLGTTYGVRLGLVSPSLTCGSASDGRRGGGGDDGGSDVGGGVRRGVDERVDSQSRDDDGDSFAVLARYVSTADDGDTTIGGPSICWTHRSAVNSSTVFIGA